MTVNYPITKPHAIDEWARAELTISCRDCDVIPKHPQAGKSRLMLMERSGKPCTTDYSSNTAATTVNGWRVLFLHCAATGRKPGNLSRTLKTMSHYGIVEMRREKKLVRPIANATEFQIVTA